MMIEISVKEIETRLEKARTLMRQQGFNILFIHGDAWRSSDFRYVAGFYPFDFRSFTFPHAIPNALFFLPLDSDPVIFVADHILGEAKDRSWIKNVYPWSAFLKFFNNPPSNFKVDKVGICGGDFMPVAIYELVTKVLKNAKIESTDIITRLRAVKSDNEISLMEKAAEIADEGMRMAFETIEEGKRETEVARTVEKAMLSAGAEKFGFETNVASGPNSGLATVVRPTDRRIKRGELIFLDICPYYHGYVNDHARGILLGYSKRESEIMDICAEAHRKGRDTVKPGVMASDVDAAVRRVITEAGFEFIQRGFHATGMDHAEAIPSAQGSYNMPLEPNMTLVVLSSIFIKGVGGIRIEDTVVVTPNGSKRLNKTEYKLLK